MPALKFCTQCGGGLIQQIPEHDDRARAVCPACHHIHYVNPKIVAGSLVTQGSRVLLCQRGIEPRKGFWTLPAGFLELHESTEDGALRETLEEACAEIELKHLYTMFDLPYISQIYLFYRASLLRFEFKPSIETLDAQLFEEHQIPWDDIAFKVVQQTLKHFFEDRKTKCFNFHKHVYRQPTLASTTAA